MMGKKGVKDYKVDSAGSAGRVLGASTKPRKVTLRFLVWKGGTKIWNKFKRNFIFRIGNDIISSKLLQKDLSGVLWRVFDAIIYNHSTPFSLQGESPEVCLLSTWVGHHWCEARQILPQRLDNWGGFARP